MEYLNLESCVAALRGGGLIAYPTEAVYGLGCDPGNADAVRRLLELKLRPQQKGLICIAADFEQVTPWLDQRHRTALARARASWPGPVTWVLRGRRRVPTLVARSDGTVALRVTAHPLANELCRRFGRPLVSTSANPSGASPARDIATIQQYFNGRIDGVLRGELGSSQDVSEIRDGATGRALRSR